MWRVMLTDIATVVGFFVVSRPFLNLANPRFLRHSHSQLLEVELEFHVVELDLLCRVIWCVSCERWACVGTVQTTMLMWFLVSCHSLQSTVFSVGELKLTYWFHFGNWMHPPVPLASFSTYWCYTNHWLLLLLLLFITSSLPSKITCSLGLPYWNCLKLYSSGTFMWHFDMKEISLWVGEGLC